MTREEAIEYLKCADTTVGKKMKTRTAEALDMAIEALSAEKAAEWVEDETTISPYYCFCSNCRKRIILGEYKNFCPNCGSLMKGVE